MNEETSFGALMEDTPKDYRELLRRCKKVREKALVDKAVPGVANACVRDLESRFVDYALAQSGNDVGRAVQEFGIQHTLIFRALQWKKQRERHREDPS